MSATDELRKLAERMDGLVLETPDMLRDAADEIDKLHAELTDLRLMSCPSCGIKVENERLREQIHWLKQGDILHVLTDQEYIDQCERERLMQVSIDALDKENVKLRELVRDMHACIEALCSMVENSPGCSMCLTNQDEEKPCAAADVYCRMRELGVEV